MRIAKKIRFTRELHETIVFRDRNARVPSAIVPGDSENAIPIESSTPEASNEAFAPVKKVKSMLTGIIKKIASISLVVAALVLTAEAQVCTPAPVGLVSWWSGDGNTLDSRSRNNGGLQGNVTFAAGQAGQTFRLGGTGDTIGNGDRVNIGNPANLQLQDFTIETWIRRASSTIVTNSPFPGFDQGIFFAYGQNGYGFLIDRVSNRIGLSNIGVAGIISPAMPVTDTNFHHVAVTKTGNQVVFYVDGVASGPFTFNQTFDFTTNAAIGARGDNIVQNAFFGDIDELSIYNRPLSAAEIAAIFNAGTAGKCKPTATVAPSGQVTWFAGDGNANDISGNGSNGTLLNGAGFAVGRAGQAFSFDGISGAVSTPPNALNTAFGALTIEAWVNPSSHGADSSGNFGNTIVSNTDGDGFALRLLNGTIQADLRLSSGNVLQTFGSALPLNQWSHVALTYDGANVRAFLDGVQTGGSFPATGTIRNTANNGICLMIGNDPAVPCIATNDGFDFQGLIDETSIYNRSLTNAEVQSIFNAGIAGKLKDNATPTGANVSVNAKSDATVAFPTVTTAGITQQIPLAAQLLPPLPNGTLTGLVYDIATSAVFTGSPTVCFNLPSFTTSGAFAVLRVLHLESGVWVNRTSSSDFATRTLCAQAPSLSPFAIVSFAPSAAPAEISGRVTDANGRSIRGAYLTAVSPEGNRALAVTNSFGYYRIMGLPSGRSYVVTVASKRHIFENPTALINLSASIAGLDFRAAPPRFGPTVGAERKGADFPTGPGRYRFRF